MVTITEEMKEVMINAQKPYVATASMDAIPNVVPIGFTKIISNDEILLMDCHMNKTKANIEANPVVAITVWAPNMKKGFQFKGQARIETDGPIFEEGAQWVRARRPQSPPKAAIVVTVTEIFQIGSSPNPRERLPS